MRTALSVLLAVIAVACLSTSRAEAGCRGSNVVVTHSCATPAIVTPSVVSQVVVTPSVVVAQTAVVVATPLVIVPTVYFTPLVAVPTIASNYNTVAVTGYAQAAVPVLASPAVAVTPAVIATPAILVPLTSYGNCLSH